MDAQTEPSYKIVVPYRGNRTIRRLIAIGGYDYVDGRLSDECFPQDWEGDEQVVIELVTLVNVRSVIDVVEAFDRRPGLRLANVAELLTLGANQPQLQTEHPIVQVEQIWKGQHRMALLICLDCLDGKRRVEVLPSTSKVQGETCKFAAVNK
jgi:hypothetical protein